MQVCEALGRADGSTGLCFGMHCVATACIAAKATPEQAERLLAPIAAGQRLTTLALSEPGTGSHFYLPQASMSRLDGGAAYGLGGSKCFVTNGGHADSYVVSAVSDDESAPPGHFSLLLVPADSPGLEWGPPWAGWGMRGNSSRSAELRNVRVPAQDRLGQEGDQIWYVFSVVTPYFLVAMAGTYLGITARAFEEGRAHLKRRHYAHSGGSLSEIAHDFNNLLTVIMAHASFMSSEREPNESEAEALSEILRAAERASALTRQLLTFSRGQPLEPTRIDVNEVVRSTHQLLRRTLSESIEISALSKEGLWPVWMDQSQLEQLLMNLALNARDAMPAGGKLLIELENEALLEPAGALCAGDYVRLRVSDTGTGMAPDVLSHVFEPFFTTKALERGTGLGLATCHTIARRAAGDILASSEPGRGSTFSVWLPRAARDERRHATETTRCASSSGNRASLWC